MKMTYKVILGAVVLALVFALGFFMGKPDQSKGAPASEQPTAEVEESVVWTCSMDPQIKQNEKGLCPLCGMDLIPLEEDDDDLGPWDLKMTEHAIKLAEVETQKAKKEYVTRELRLVGKVEYDEKRVGVISAWAGGRVDRMYVDFTGVMINRNDHLVDLYSPELLSAQNELLSATNSFRNAQRSGANTKSALRRVMAAREKLRLYGLTPDQASEIEKRGTPSDQLTVYSHLEGYVLEKHIVLGNYVKQGDPLYTVADLSRVWVKLEAYEDDLAWLSFGQEVNFQTHAWPGEIFTGRIVYIDPVIDAGTRTVKVRLNVDNSNGRLKPDMFVRASIFAKVGASGKVVHEGLAGKWISPMHPEVVKDHAGQCDVCGMDLVPAETLGLAGGSDDLAPVVIPISAPLITGERAVVYLKDPERMGVFTGREIVLGPRAGDLYVVKSGLAEGDEVVINGNFKIDSELQIRGKYSMMYHESEGEEAEEVIDAFEVPAVFHESLAGAWQGYFQVQKALSDDDLATAKAAAGKLSRAMDNVSAGPLSAKAANGWNDLGPSMKQQADKIAGAAGIDQARLEFEALSNQIIRLVRQFGVGEQTVYRFHCPMAMDDQGADWLQNHDELGNPYFGSMMYSCGTQEEVISGVISNENHDDHEHDHEEMSSTLHVPDSFHKSIQPTWASYFAMQKALSDDDPRTAQVAARGVMSSLPRAAVSGLGPEAAVLWKKLSDNLKQVAGELVVPGDIDGIRTRFELISGYMTELGEKLGAGDQIIYQFHCPMAFDDRGASWLQDNDSLANPYFGSMMYGCGSQTGVIGKQ